MWNELPRTHKNHTSLQICPPTNTSATGLQNASEIHALSDSIIQELVVPEASFKMPDIQTICILKLVYMYKLNWEADFIACILCCIPIDRLSAAACSRWGHIHQQGSACAIPIYIHWGRGWAWNLGTTVCALIGSWACPPEVTGSPRLTTSTNTHRHPQSENSIHAHMQSLTTFDAADPTIVNSTSPFEPTTLLNSSPQPSSSLHGHICTRTHSPLRTPCQALRRLADALHDLVLACVIVANVELTVADSEHTVVLPIYGKRLPFDWGSVKWWSNDTTTITILGNYFPATYFYLSVTDWFSFLFLSLSNQRLDHVLSYRR